MNILGGGNNDEKQTDEYKILTNVAAAAGPLRMATPSSDSSRVVRAIAAIRAVKQQTLLL